MRLNDKASELQVGDIVTTEFDMSSKDVRRKITSIKKSKSYESGRSASADAGVPCPACHRHFALPINYVDAGWFLPATDIVETEVPDGYYQRNKKLWDAIDALITVCGGSLTGRVLPAVPLRNAMADVDRAIAAALGDTRNR